MGNGLAWLIAVVVPLSIAGGGCSRSARSNELAALDQAYKSGVLNEDEYQAKKTGLESQSKALEALDKALTAGVVTQAEYPTIKARLIAKGSALAALEKARRAGVFSQEEYLAKKSALLASDSSAVPPAAVVSPPAATPAPAATPLDTVQSDHVSPAAAPVMAAAQPVRVADTAATPNSKPAPARAENFQPRTPAPMSGQKSATESAPSAPSSAAQGHVLRMKTASAIDQYGFDRPMPSLSMLVPVDWQTQGGTTWNIKDKCNTIQTTLRATGPDGRGIEIFPAFNWVWADDPKPLQMTAAQTAQLGSRPCDVSPPMSAADFLRRGLSRYRPNAQLMGIEPAPKLLATLQQQAREGEQSAVRYNLRQTIRPDAARGRVRYSVNGQAIEEWIVVATVTTGTVGPRYNAQTNRMDQVYSYSCVAYVTGERAPQGRLEASEKFFELVVGTSRWNPAWQAKVNGNAQAIQAIELKGVRDRSAIVSKNAEDISNIRRQSFENTQRSQEHISEQFSQNMRGVETYRNPSTGETVDLSNQYGQAWVNNRGEYLLSDQPGFDPSVTFKEDWKPLEKVNK
jgi:hypothetical protein